MPRSDKAKREAVEAKNQAESLLHSAEKSLKDYGDKVTADDRGAIETAIANLRSAIEAGDAADIKAKSETLSEVSMKLGEAMYKAAQAEQAVRAAMAQSGGKQEDVVDADFEEIDDDEDKKKSA